MNFSRPDFLRSTVRFVLALLVSAMATPAAFVQAGSPPVIISPSTATVIVGTSFNYQIILANFASGTYIADNLAPGLTLNARAGVISGVPTDVGTFAITLHAANPDGSTTAPLTLSVVPADPPVITSALNATGLRSSPFLYQITASNFPTGYGATGLPDGLSIDPVSGVISGAPTTKDLFPVTISATNFQGTTSATLALQVVAAIPVVTLTADTPTANPLRGEAGRFTLTRTGDDLTQPVLVSFSIRGTAQNGVDYQVLSLTKTIKAGKSVKRIHVNALRTDDIVPGDKKTVKLTLQLSDAYTLGDASVAKVKIMYDP